MPESKDIRIHESKKGRRRIARAFVGDKCVATYDNLYDDTSLEVFLTSKGLNPSNIKTHTVEPIVSDCKH